MGKMLILFAQLVSARHEAGPGGVVIRYRNAGTVHGSNAERWDRLNLSPRGVVPAPEPKGDLRTWRPPFKRLDMGAR